MTNSQNVAPLEMSLHRFYLIMGIIGALFYLAVTLVFVYEAAWNIDGSFTHPIAAAISSGLLFGSFFVISLYLIAAYYRERLKLTAVDITQQTVLITKFIRLADISRIRWSVWRIHRLIIIENEAVRMRIWLNNFPGEQSQSLINKLRDLVPKEKHVDWNKFIDREQSLDSVPEKTRRTAFICMFLFQLIGIFGLRFWYYGYGIQFLCVGGACLLASIWYLFRIKKFETENNSEEKEV